MKIACVLNESLAGFYSPLVKEGFKWVWWNPHEKPIFDLVDEEKPDVLMIDDIDTALLRCIDTLKKENKNLVTVYYNKSTRTIHVNNIHSESGCDLVFPVMVDMSIFYPRQLDATFACELARVGSVSDPIRKLCHPIDRFQVKIFGNDNGGGNGLSQYLGQVTIEEECSIYTSALLTYVETFEEALKVLACHGCPISTNDDCDLKSFHIDIDYLSDVVHNHSNNPELREDSISVLTKIYFPYNTFEFNARKLIEAINESAIKQK